MDLPTLIIGAILVVLILGMVNQQAQNYHERRMEYIRQDGWEDE